MLQAKTCKVHLKETAKILPARKFILQTIHQIGRCPVNDLVNGLENEFTRWEYFSRFFKMDLAGFSSLSPLGYLTVRGRSTGSIKSVWSKSTYGCCRLKLNDLVNGLENEFTRWEYFSRFFKMDLAGFSL
jgi:hypothetical protein